MTKTKLSPLFILSGPSGVGKGVVIAALLETNPNLRLAVSATTRMKRKGEKEGIHYYFLTKADFEKKSANGEFLEWCEVHHEYYGTLLSEVTVQRKEPSSILLEIDVQGALKIKKAYPNTVLIFLDIPSLPLLEQRLRTRQTDTEDQIQTRLETAKKELASKFAYDHVILNDSVAIAAHKINEIILRRTTPVSKNQEKRSQVSLTQLLQEIPNKFLLSVVAARRARQIKDNLHQSGVLETDPTIPVIEALKEIQEGKVKVIQKVQNETESISSIEKKIKASAAGENEGEKAGIGDKKGKEARPKNKSRSLAA